MQSQRAELLAKYMALAADGQREAEASFTEEARQERDHAGLREQARAADDSASRARDAAEAAEARMRQEIGEHEAALERLTACQEHHRRRAEDHTAAVQKLARVARRLAGSVTVESDLAERAVGRAVASLRHADAFLAEARLRVAASAERLRHLREAADAKRAFANAEAERVDDFDRRIVADIAALAERRAASRSAMSRAWVYRNVADSYSDSP